MIEQLNGLADHELTWEMLAAYEIADQVYETWCEMVGLVAMTERANDAYEIVHAAYARLWMTMGDQFFARLERYVDRWNTRARASERAGNRGLVARLTGRAA